MLVTDGALLIESGVHLRFDRLVVVHCAPELQLRGCASGTASTSPRRARGSRRSSRAP